MFHLWRGGIGQITKMVITEICSLPMAKHTVPFTDNSETDDASKTKVATAHQITSPFGYSANSMIACN